MEIKGYCVTVDGSYVHDTFSPKAELARRCLFLNSHVPGRPLPTVEEMKASWVKAEAKGFQCTLARLVIDPPDKEPS
jgi:hypothetical protein